MSLVAINTRNKKSTGGKVIYIPLRFTPYFSFYMDFQNLNLDILKVSTPEFTYSQGS